MNKLIELFNKPRNFALVVIVIVSWSVYLGFSSITIGGIFLVFGAWYLNAGNIFYSILAYALADVCWLTNALTSNDIFGAVTVSIGIAVGLIVTFKMRLGIFRKSIKI